MRFTMHPDILSAFPDVAIGIVIVCDMVNDRSVGKIIDMLRSEEAHQAKSLPAEDLGKLPEIVLWREIYRAFGSNPKEYRSSVEALLRRARSGKTIPDINPLVNLYNYLSLKYHLPAGAEDMGKVMGDILLTFADGSESGVALGFDAPESPDPGEVIYRDESGFLCRKWNWREADRTKIEADTRSAVLVFEKAPGIGRDVLDAALSEAKAHAETFLSAHCEIMVLDAQYPSADVRCT